jgi:hypothetical protein
MNVIYDSSSQINSVTLKIETVYPYETSGYLPTKKRQPPENNTYKK